MNSTDHQKPCEWCKATADGRNLIIAFDGTSNQYGENNTNVVELYAYISKGKNQLKYYNSGIGTYARPTFRSIKYWGQVLDNKIDLLVAWNFEKVLLSGYRWLSDNYRPNDKIFLFGFSRGAYQVRALAGMIHKVGLILPGNAEQIPFAYELYAHPPQTPRNTLFRNFMRAFCHTNVKIHFLGAWDTVSSVGIFRGKSLPMTDEFNDSICYFRHALALDERRVKFLPEYIQGGESYLQNSSANREHHETAAKDSSAPRIKEVWFAGCHSDIGGGNKKNTELNSDTMPVLWMRNEAYHAGLRLDDPRFKWDWEKLRASKPTNSLSLSWRCLEIFPWKRLSYMRRRHHVWSPHWAKYRVIKPGQKIHVSVAFIDGYQPMAELPTDEDWAGICWEKIVAKGRWRDLDWAREIEHILEMDIFDIPDAQFIERAKRNMTDPFLTHRLNFMASTRQGAQAIMANSGLQLIKMMLDGDEKMKEDGAKVLSELAVHVPVIDLPSDASELLIKTLLGTLIDAHQQVRVCGVNAVGSVFKEKEIRAQLVQHKVRERLYEIIKDPKSGNEWNAAQSAFLQFIQHCDKTELNSINILKLGEGTAVGHLVVCAFLSMLTLPQAAARAVGHSVP